MNKIHVNFRDIIINDLTDEEKNLIRLFRNMNGQHGVCYSPNKLVFTDGVATTWIDSESEFIIDIFAKILHWEDGNYINYLRKRYYNRLI